MSLLAIVDSPLQLLNARECRWLLTGHDAGGALLLISRATRNSQQLRRMAADMRWQQVAPLPHVGSSARDKRQLKRRGEDLLRGLTACRHAIIGELRSDVQLHLATFRRPRRLWLVDDGTANLSNRSDWLVAPQPGDSSQLLERAAKQLGLGLRCLRAERATWFTAYPKARRAGVPLLRNEYRLHRHLLTSRPNTGHSWVIGSNICEKRGFPVPQYRAFLAELGRRYGKLHYIPHRYEDPNKLQQLDLPILQLNTCIEHAICHGDRPARVVGPPSSAFVSLQAIAGSQLQLCCHLLDPDAFPERERAFICRTQEYLANLVPCEAP
jgi:hypothetical protein